MSTVVDYKYNPSDFFTINNQCGNEHSEIMDVIGSFYACENVDFVSMAQSVKTKGFFGLLKQGNEQADRLNDINYLMVLLSIMWWEKFEDAYSNCSTHLSAVPEKYICDFKIDCIRKYFECRGIDISCFLLSFKVNKQFYVDESLEQISRLSVVKTTVYYNPVDPATSCCNTQIVKELNNEEQIICDVECNIQHVFNENEIANEPYIFDANECEESLITYNEDENPC